MPTTINDELTRIEGAKADIVTAIGNKGVTVPANATIDDYADLIDTIQTGGDDDTFEKLIRRTITSVDIPSGVTTIPEYFFSGCTSLSSVTFPSSLTTTGQRSFYGCSSLTTVDLRNTSLRTIGSSSLSTCRDLEEVYIPESITQIQNAAFNGSSKLKVLVLLKTVPISLGTNALASTAISAGTGKIYVPYSSDHSVLNAYKTATRWSTYANQIYELDANGNIPT